jgi:hypothetical protein
MSFRPIHYDDLAWHIAATHLPPLLPLLRLLADELVRGNPQRLRQAVEQVELGQESGSAWRRSTPSSYSLGAAAGGVASGRPSLDQVFSDPEEEHLLGSCLAVPLDHYVDEVLGHYAGLEPPVAFLKDLDLFPWQELPALMERIVGPVRVFTVLVGTPTHFVAVLRLTLWQESGFASWPLSRQGVRRNVETANTRSLIGRPSVRVAADRHRSAANSFVIMGSPSNTHKRGTLPAPVRIDVECWLGASLAEMGESEGPSRDQGRGPRVVRHRGLARG